MIQKFLQRYREAFGDGVPLPVAFGYSDTPVEEIRKIPRCMIGAIRKVCDGQALTLSVDNVRRRKSVYTVCTDAGTHTALCFGTGTL